MNKFELFEKEALIKFLALHKQNAAAQRAYNELTFLNILDDELRTELERIIKTYDDHYLIYMLFYRAMLPKEFTEQVDVLRINGAFISDSMGSRAFSTEITLHTGDDNINLVYDVYEGKFYTTDKFAKDKYRPILEEYFEHKPNFNQFINF